MMKFPVLIIHIIALFVGSAQHKQAWEIEEGVKGQRGRESEVKDALTVVNVV